MYPNMSRNILIALFSLALAAPVGVRASGHEEHHEAHHEAAVVAPEAHDEEAVAPETEEEHAAKPVETSPKKPSFFAVMMSGFGSFFGEIITKFD